MILISGSGPHDRNKNDDGKENLNAAGNRNVTIKAFPGLNHLFQHCKTCTMFEYGELPETISTEVLAYIQEWIATQTGLKKS